MHFARCTHENKENKRPKQGRATHTHSIPTRLNLRACQIARVERRAQDSHQDIARHCISKHTALSKHSPIQTSEKQQIKQRPTHRSATWLQPNKQTFTNYKGHQTSPNANTHRYDNQNIHRASHSDRQRKEDVEKLARSVLVKPPADAAFRCFLMTDFCVTPWNLYISVMVKGLPLPTTHHPC